MNRIARVAMITVLSFGFMAGLGATAQAASPSCTASQLTAAQAGTGAGMSQPYSAIGLTNHSKASCTLQGYPSITSMSTAKHVKRISVTYGAMQNITTPKPKRIVLAPGAKAWFAIGTATAYDPPLVTFRSVTYRIAGSTITTRIALQATAPTGKPFPVKVTAFGKGVPPRD